MFNFTINSSVEHALTVWYDIAGCLTVVMSAFAFYVIQCHTPKSCIGLRKYILIRQVFLTVIDINFTVFFRNVPIYPAIGGICNGLLCRMGLPFHVPLVMTMFLASHYGSTAILCFLYRHQSLMPSESRWKFENINLVNAAIFSVYSLPTIPVLLAWYEQLDGANYILQKHPGLAWLLDEPSAWAIYDTAKFTTSPIIIANVCVILVSLSFMLVASVLVWHVWYTLYEMRKTMSARTMYFHQRLTMVLVAMIALPSSLLAIPATTHSTTILTGRNWNTPCLVAQCIQCSHCFVYSFLLILVSPPYRRAVVIRLLCLTRASSAVTPVTPQPDSTTRGRRDFTPTGKY